MKGSSNTAWKDLYRELVLRNFPCLDWVRVESTSDQHLDDLLLGLVLNNNDSIDFLANEASDVVQLERLSCQHSLEVFLASAVVIQTQVKELLQDLLDIAVLADAAIGVKEDLREQGRCFSTRRRTDAILSIPCWR